MAVERLYNMISCIYINIITVLLLSQLFEFHNYDSYLTYNKTNSPTDNFLFLHFDFAHAWQVARACINTRLSSILGDKFGVSVLS